jgi:hypothetical protein
MIEFDFHNLRGILAQPAGSFKDARCLKAKKESGFTATTKDKDKAATKESEYLPQRRKDRKEKIVLNLAFLAPWRE